MIIRAATEDSFTRIARHLSKLDPLHKGYYNFIPSDTWQPNVNLYETSGCYLVCVDLAGVEKSEIELTVENHRLKMRGKRSVPLKSIDPNEPCNTRQFRVHLMEIDHGNFSREVELPADIDATKIEASANNGLLWIELPKK